MIAFDNGPAGGDYVRYIDDLMKRAAVTAATAAPRMPDDVVESLDDRRRRAAAAPRAAGVAANRALPAPTQTSGFVAPTAASTSAAAAAAVASALMSGEMGRRGVLSSRLRTAAIAAVVGFGLALFGFLLHPASLLLMIAGGVLFAGGLRTLVDAAGVRRPGGRRF